ncbi:hypothetical protein M1466_00205 [Candidatus Dependentiae bacterium]|nr:hypothetical protein [Candidatus Dependentiae bacterium]
MRLNFVTGNAGKFAEVSTFITTNRPDITLVQTVLDLPEIQSSDQREIAVYKARHAFALLQEPVLVDDSAVYFELYNQFPGALAKLVYHGLGLAGLQRLYLPGDPASMQTVFVYYASPAKALIAEGITTGTLVNPVDVLAHPAFPYNRIFIPDGAQVTYEVLEQEGRKDEFNHRIAALRKLLVLLEDE